MDPSTPSVPGATHWIARYLKPRVDEALADTPAVLIDGPRQSGKTTFCRRFANRRYLTLDDATTLASARADPTGFVRNLNIVTIDEVQRAPQLLIAIKQSIDENRMPGRFLLTGSANLMQLPTIAESLAGRMERFQMFPLSGAEIAAAPGRWLSQVFDATPAELTGSETGAALVQRVLAGGYPECVKRSEGRRNAWLRSYIDALLARDVSDVAHIEKRHVLPRLLECLAQTAGQLSNMTQLGGAIGLDDKTTSKYVAALELLHLVHRVQPYSRNALSRLVKSPKLQFPDAALLAELRGIRRPQIERDRHSFGPLLESFVYGELLKLSTWSDERFRLSSYRDKDQSEVDFVIENAALDVVGVEVKAAASVGGNDFAGLRKLAKAVGQSFIAGIVLYDGTQTLPMGERMWATPVSSLWSS